MSRGLIHLRAAATWSTGSALAGALVAAAAPDVVDLVDSLRAPGSLGQAPLAQLLVWLAAVALVLCVGWLWTVLTVLVARVVLSPGVARVRRPAGVPRALHRWVLAACGLALAGAAIAPAHATGPGVPAPAPGPAPVAGSPSAADLLSGLPLPERATAPAPIRKEYVVRPGDSLWRIAASRLPADASDAAVTAAWHDLHELNRAEIGADPDLIHPTQRLRLPGA